METTSTAPAHGRHTPPRPWLLHGRLSCLIFLAFAIMGSWVPVFTLYLQTLNFSPAETAWASAANAIGAMLAPQIWGQIADRWLAKERCISLCAILSGILLWLLSLLSDPLAVIVLSIVLWFFLIPVIGLTGAFIFRQLEHPDREYGKIRLWGTVGWMGASWGLTWWFQFDSADGSVNLGDSLRLGALAAFAVAGFALTMPHAPPSPLSIEGQGSRSFVRRFADAPLRALRMFRERSFLVYCACMFGFYITMPFTIQLNPLLLDRIGIEKKDVPLYLTVCQSMEVFLLAFLPALLTNVGLKTTMLAGGLAWTAGLAALSVGSPVALVLAALSTGGVFICCFVISGQVFVNRQATPDIRASAQGILIFINGSGLLVGHFLVGWIRHTTVDQYDVAYRIAAIVSAAMFLLFAAGFTVAPMAKSEAETLVADPEMP